MGDVQDTVKVKKDSLIKIVSGEYSFNVLPTPTGQKNFCDPLLRESLTSFEMAGLIGAMLAKPELERRFRTLEILKDGYFFTNTACAYTAEGQTLIDYPAREENTLCMRSDESFAEEGRNPLNGFRHLDDSLIQSVSCGRDREKILEIIFGKDGRMSILNFAKQFSNGLRIHVSTTPVQEQVIFPVTIAGIKGHYLDIDLWYASSHASSFLGRDRRRNL